MNRRTALGFFGVFIVLTLLVVAYDLRGQEAADSGSLTERCSPDPLWTPQEAFVWERVCTGKVADFNTSENYGGDLDPNKPGGLPDTRVLRPAFLEMILLKEPYRSALRRHGVVIIGARFIEAIDLEGAELPHQLGLVRSLIEKNAEFNQLKSKYPNWLIAYGHYPLWAAIPAIFLIIAGAVVLRVSGEGVRNAMPFGLAYSFDMLLPIIKLREKHYEIDLRGWPRYYFYMQKIMGYVLASFLIVGLAGLTK
jgi:hypothetical protein